MKRASLMIVLLLMVALILPVSAQVRVGIIGGINFSDMEGAGEREVSGKTVFGVGGMLDLGLWKGFSLCLEPMYIQKYAIAEEINIEGDIPESDKMKNRGVQLMAGISLSLSGR